MIVVKDLELGDTLMQMYERVLCGIPTVVRGQLTRNVPNMAIVMDSSFPIITDFPDRKLNLNYAKKEWLWYLGADPFDDSIMQHATMWAKLKQPNGSFFSNYGQYIFGTRLGLTSQFYYALRMLRSDPNTRRASIVLLQPDHLFEENIDTVCTYSINFTVVGNALDMTVMMRSNDVVFGFTNDAFCFWNLMRFMYTLLARDIPGLTMGRYTHFTNSMHVYERHFDMLKAIVENGGFRYTQIPMPTPKEVISLIYTKGQHVEGDYTAWLKA